MIHHGSIGLFSSMQDHSSLFILYKQFIVWVVYCFMGFRLQYLVSPPLRSEWV